MSFSGFVHPTFFLNHKWGTASVTICWALVRFSFSDLAAPNKTTIWILNWRRNNTKPTGPWWGTYLGTCWFPGGKDIHPSRVKHTSQKKTYQHIISTFHHLCLFFVTFLGMVTFFCGSGCSWPLPGTNLESLERLSHRIHVWNIYLQLPKQLPVGKYVPWILWVNTNTTPLENTSRSLLRETNSYWGKPLVQGVYNLQIWKLQTDSAPSVAFAKTITGMEPNMINALRRFSRWGCSSVFLGTNHTMKDMKESLPCLLHEIPNLNLETITKTCPWEGIS